ncbi:uncharacterized protein SCHCODRAFT_02593869 [Schizophyllum commune H4-8]|uniref:uncharacterized protein n=1 Tax=Schizophyllum commune (strain H4-8 / FGSC 9210) TaxID=578458 RepID=UPI0021602E46|nr:uncharacterized protein SCHCODRAFT_02593869 [Schizophyllum commune H4-8]KAI5885363.1 hypothetical protein SCHCODRAFT_02593869 [Schizophyllum commune H4-8]
MVGVVSVSSFSQLLLALLRVFKTLYLSGNSAALHSQHPRVTLPQAHCEWGGSPGGIRSSRQHRGGSDEVRRLLGFLPHSLRGGVVRAMRPLWAGAERRPGRGAASHSEGGGSTEEGTTRPAAHRSTAGQPLQTHTARYTSLLGWRGATDRERPNEHQEDYSLHGYGRRRGHILGARA